MSSSPPSDRPIPTGPRGRTTSFDRAAPIYEPTRRLADEATEGVGRMLRDAVSPRGTVLEIGIGTGRIARHLARGGKRTVGIDISATMLREASPAAGTLDLVVADARLLP